MQVDSGNARVTANLGWRLANQAVKQDTNPDEDGALGDKLTF